MAVVYSVAAKNARLQAVVTTIGGTGVLEIGTTGMASILASIPLDAVSGTVANAVLTFAGFPKSDTTADASGTAAEARIRTATGGQTVISGLTVATSGADIVLDSVTITAGQTITLNSAAITHAP